MTTPNRLTEHQWDTVRELRAAGFAVCIFNPDEIGDADPGVVEERMCQAGWDACGTSPDDDDDDDTNEQ